MNKGLFITLEGGEGSGKSTLAKNLKERLSNFNVILTREPGGSIAGEQIRDIILNNEISPKTEALLFMAGRNDHVEKLIKPNINDNNIVICDRFIESSCVYQGGVKGLGVDTIYDMNLWSVDNFLPDLIIYLKLDYKEGLNRIASNNREVNRFDLEDNEFHKNIENTYNELLLNKDNVLVIDASMSEVDIVEVVYDRIKELLDE